MLTFKQFILEADEPDFFDHNDPAQMKMLNELDGYTASPNVALRPTTLEFLRSKYKGRSGEVTLWRAMVFNSLDEAAKLFKVKDVKAGEQFEYKRDKESSWTKSQRFAINFAQDGDLDEQYTVVLESKIPVKEFLLDVEDLSKNDLKHIYLQDQKEVIVDSMDRRVKIVKVVDNHND